MNGTYTASADSTYIELDCLEFRKWRAPDVPHTTSDTFQGDAALAPKEFIGKNEILPMRFLEGGE